MNNQIYLLVAAFFVTFIISRLAKFKRAIRAVSDIPGYRVLFEPLAFPGAVLPTSWWNPGCECTWRWRKHLYADGENFSVIPFVTSVPVIYTSNLDVARQVTMGGQRSNFIKPSSVGRILLQWGLNLITSEGELWRKHRRVIGPAFNNQAYQLVWAKTIKVYHEMVKHEGWLGKKSVDVPVFQDLTMNVALYVLASAGFGFPFSWPSSLVEKDGTMSVQKAIRIVCERCLIATVVPKWAWKFPVQILRELRVAHAIVDEFMRNKVAERKADLRDRSENGFAENEDEFCDVFSTLIRANEAEGKLKLDDQELLGNVFGMLIAGHETSAVTIAASLAFLALYQDIQEDVLQQIIEVVGNDREPEFEDYHKLNKILHVLYETLRLFPPAFVSMREATEDTVLAMPNPLGQEGSTFLPISKGTQVFVDWIGIQYNPRYFEDPFTFKPSRWSDNSNEDLVTTFGIGPRACIGRKFAMTEVVCFLALLLKQWRVEPLMQNGEDLEGWRQRVFDAQMKLTMHIRPTSLRFVARTSV